MSIKVLPVKIKKAFSVDVKERTARTMVIHVIRQLTKIVLSFFLNFFPMQDLFINIPDLSMVSWSSWPCERQREGTWHNLYVIGFVVYTDGLASHFPVTFKADTFVIEGDLKVNTPILTIHKLDRWLIPTGGSSVSGVLYNGAYGRIKFVLEVYQAWNSECDENVETLLHLQLQM